MPKSTQSPQSPGAFLAQMLEKKNLNPFRLSKDINLSQSAVRLITLGKTRMTVPVALRLGKYFDTTPEYWLTMQMKWDLAEADKDKELGNAVKAIVPYKKQEAKAPLRKNIGKKAAVKPGAKAAEKKTPGRKPSAKAVEKKPAEKKPGRRGRAPAAK